VSASIQKFPSGPSLLGLGSPAKYDPKRLRQPLRAAAAFLRFPPLQRLQSRMQCPGLPARTCRPRRFNVLDGPSSSRLMPRFLVATALGVHPTKLFPLTWSRLAVAFRTGAVLPANLSVRPQPLPAYRFRVCRPTNKFAVRRIRPGFWALLPLRILQPPAVLTPRTIRCSPGFRLSKDFALPAPSPSSRAFHSRTYAPCLLADALSLSGFLCEEVSFPLRRLSTALKPSRSGCCPF